MTHTPVRDLRRPYDRPALARRGTLARVAVASDNLSLPAPPK